MKRYILETLFYSSPGGLAVILTGIVLLDRPSDWLVPALAAVWGILVGAGILWQAWEEDRREIACGYLARVEEEYERMAEIQQRVTGS